MITAALKRGQRTPTLSPNGSQTTPSSQIADQHTPGPPKSDAQSLSHAYCTIRASKQAVVEAGNGKVRVRWMTAREYARLQGAPDYVIDGIRTSQATFGFGDAVCVPAISFIAENFLIPLTEG